MVRGNESAGLDKALKCLTAMGRRPQGASIAQLASECGLSRQTLGRILATLVAADFVTRNPDKTYRIDMRVFDWIRTVAEANNPLQTVRLELVRAVNETKRAARFCVLEGDMIIYLERVLWFDGFPVPQVSPTHEASTNSVAARVILAFNNDESVDGSYFKIDQQSLNEIRNRGYDESPIESPPGRIAFAVPVLAPTGLAIGAVTATHAANELAWGKGFTPVALAAQRISRTLGYLGPWPGGTPHDFFE